MKLTADYKSRFRILKGGKISLVVSALVCGATLSYASPTDGVVTSGSATINQSGATTNINQSTQNATINWQSFSIASGESVNFNQPNSSSITLNRVVGNESSVINGALNANGQVWLLNSNGVLFGKNASINTAGLVATTKALSDADFNAGNYNFKGDSTASVINMGTIDITNSGYAVFLANSVSNEGTVRAVRGVVQLVGASDVSINLNGNSLVNLTVNKGVLDALVENKGAVYTDGGEIYLTTNAVNELLDGMVNNTGTLQAQTLDDVTGKIVLFAHGGKTNVAGSLKAKGGFIETSGKEFSVADGTIIKAKEWLIDPTDITIESTGSTSDLTGSSIKASFIESTINGGTGITLTATNDINVNENLALTNGDFTLSAGNDINVNENIAWTEGLFTLTAVNDINVNAIMSASGDANLAMNGNVLVGFNDTEASGFKGRVDLASNMAAPTININGTAYTIIRDLGVEGSTTTTDLQGMNGGLSGNYVLGSNIDASATSTWDSGAGFSPVGPAGGASLFQGKFNGLGHTISDLTISRAGSDIIGLFGWTSGSHISNVGLTNANITGGDNTGGLVGESSTASKFTNNYVTGSITGGTSVGSIIGWDNSAAGTNVIQNNYSTASISGNSHVGGLVGNSHGSITTSYATGAVSGNNAGGLVGYGNGSISNLYATGTVSGSTVGGLVGYNAGTISNSYATGVVSGSGGGLFGGGSGTVSLSFFDKTLNSGMSDEATYGKTTAELQTLSTFTGWSITQDSSVASKYPTLLATGWTIGADAIVSTPVSTPTSTPVSTPTSTPVSTPVSTTTSVTTVLEEAVTDTTQEVEEIISSIVNESQTAMLTPSNIGAIGAPVVETFGEAVLPEGFEQSSGTNSNEDEE